MPEEKKDQKQNKQIIQIVCFNLAEEEYGLGIDQIQEVIRLGPISPIPQVPSFCLGVMNMRGRIGSVFDLREILGIPKKGFDDETRLLDIDMGGEVIGLVVDKVLENIKLDTSKVDPPPDVKMAVSRECIQGIGDHNNRLITILNLEQIYRYVAQSMKSNNGKE